MLELPRQKTQGFWQTFSIFISCIVETGIFISVSSTLEVSPESLGLLMVYWVFGGFISVCGGMTYAELGCAFPKSGGERTYFAKTLGSALAATFTYCYTFFIKASSIAVLATTVGEYTVELIHPDCLFTENIQKLIAAECILVCFFVNSFSKNVAKYSQIVFTVLKLCALLFIIIPGLIVSIRGGGIEFTDFFKFRQFNISKLGVAIVNVNSSLDGWNIIACTVFDMKNPKRDLPRVIFFGMILLLILYSATVASYISVLGYTTVMESPAVAQLFANAVYGRFSFVVSILIALSALGALNGNMYAIPTVCMTAGYMNEIPRIFALVRKDQGTPVVSSSALTIASLLFLCFQFEKIIIYCSFCSWTFYFLVCCSLYVARYKKKSSGKHFQVPIWMPIILQAASLYIFYDIFFVKKMYINFSVMALSLILMFSINLCGASRLIPRYIIRIHDLMMLELAKLYNLRICSQRDL